MQEKSESIKPLLQAAVDLLTAAGVQSPRVDAEILLAHALDTSRGQLGIMLALNKTVPGESAIVFKKLLARRCAREPLQHIIGAAPFRNLELTVGEGVFVPRPETEMIVDIARAMVESQNSPVFLEFCAGSGAICLALAQEICEAQVFAIEKSDTALQYALRNKEQANMANADIQKADVFDIATIIDLTQIFPDFDRPCDVLVSNPPYVPENDIPDTPEVRDYDPQMALYSGQDGLDMIRHIAKVSKTIAKTGVIVEHTECQGAQIQSLFKNAGWDCAGTVQDLTGRDRFTWGAISAPKL